MNKDIKKLKTALVKDCFLFLLLLFLTFGNYYYPESLFDNCKYGYMFSGFLSFACILLVYVMFRDAIVVSKIEKSK